MAERPTVSGHGHGRSRRGATFLFPPSMLLAGGRGSSSMHAGKVALWAGWVEGTTDGDCADGDGVRKVGGQLDDGRKFFRGFGRELNHAQRTEAEHVRRGGHRCTVTRWSGTC